MREMIDKERHMQEVKTWDNQNISKIGQAMN
jgi:hypothetical protein